jgi:outer membrane protein assembly factor BamE
VNLLTRFFFGIYLVGLLFGTTACSRWIYRIDVQQGNVITQDMLAQLHAGMEKDKVRFIMGTPLMVDVFHQNRWDYVYSMQPAGRAREQRQVSLYFNNEDKLARIAGDIKTASHPLKPAQRRDESVAVPDLEEKKGLWARMFGDGKDKHDDKGKETALVLRKPGAKPETKPSKPATSQKKGIFGGILGGRSPRAPESSEGGASDQPGGGLNTN